MLDELDMEIASKIATKILEEKFRLMALGKHPRLILVDHATHALLEDAWVQSMKDLPWGDTAVYEYEKRKDKQEVFLADGTFHGLWLVKVDTIEGFEVK